MDKERRLLRSEKAKYKQQLTHLKHYIRELKAQCSACKTVQEHVGHDMMKAENDAEFYRGEIKNINNRLKECS